jgi:hypothetical protein
MSGVRLREFGIMSLKGPAKNPTEMVLAAAAPHSSFGALIFCPGPSLRESLSIFESSLG